jgi:hypothetical protein
MDMYCEMKEDRCGTVASLFEPPEHEEAQDEKAFDERVHTEFKCI